MNITNIKIENFRLFDDIEINFEEITTAIVGKNNSGKTSFSQILNIFMNEKEKFEFEDFSFSSHQKFNDSYSIFKQINDTNREEKIKEILKIIPKIKLILTIKYKEEDNWTNLQPFINSLDDSDEIKILFEYSPKDTIRLFDIMKDNKNNLIDELRSSFNSNYQIRIRPYSNAEEGTILKLNDVQKLLKCHFIEAQRDLEDNKSNNTKLSSIFQKQYDYQTKKDDNNSDALIESTDKANSDIEEKLKDFFKQFIGSFEKFGFPGIDNEILELQSNIEIESLFRNNVRLVYNHGGNILPEKYNGLGYKNLMYIISKILSFQILHQDKKSDLNLLFIEEPEAHMHPQMQTVFIKNITKFLEEKEFNVQVIISTHSSHILTNAKLESIRYLIKNTKTNTSRVKDLRKFHTEHRESEALQFLEQYLTLDKGELFFADKAILFEGVVERLLMPVFIQKLDSSSSVKLAEQYISYIEVGGRYMEKFKELLEFLEITTLIITDIDSVEKKEITNKKGNSQTTYPKCEIRDDSDLVTSNECLKNWLPAKTTILDLLSVKEIDKIDKKIRVAYQTKIDDRELKCGRSFEEAFILDNLQYILDKKEKLFSIKNKLSPYDTVDEIKENSYDIAKSINKTDFAFDLLSNQKNFDIPAYIKEGLIWLSQK